MNYFDSWCLFFSRFIMLCFIPCMKDANGSISFDEMEAGKAASKRAKASTSHRTKDLFLWCKLLI